MAYELYEGFKNGASLLNGLSEAANPNSEGGATITMGELVKLLADVGIEIVQDVQDDEDPA